MAGGLRKGVGWMYFWDFVSRRAWSWIPLFFVWILEDCCTLGGILFLV